jgi:DNA-binding NtrC family response regulator
VTRTIHDNSARCDHSFISVDCATVPEADLEATLFGQHGGTIHLANVDALTPLLQARLAHALNDQQAPGAPSRPIGVRVLASTARDLVEDVRSGAFNREFYNALAVVTMRLPRFASGAKTFRSWFGTSSNGSTTS